MPLKPKRQWTEDEKELARQAHKAKCRQAEIDAGGVNVEIEQIRHERLVHNDEELRAFRAEEVEFFTSRYGQHFSDGITELDRDIERLRGFPALVRIKAYRSKWPIFDMEAADDLVLEYDVEYPDGFIPKQIDMSAHEAALRGHTGELRCTGFNDVENLAFNLIGACMSRNLTGFAPLVKNEMHRRMPDVPEDEVQAAYNRAYSEWVEAYSK